MILRVLLCLCIGFNRLLAEPTAARQVQGAYEAQKRSVHKVHEHSNTGETQQLSAVDMLCNKSNAIATDEGYITVTPHRAEYNIELLESPKNSVKHVKGKLVIEIVDKGDGWAFEQHCLLYITNDTGDIDEFRMTVVSWESKDGRRYTFMVTTLCNQQVTDCVHGYATSDPNSLGVAIYQQPEVNLVRLPAGTLFPIQYLNKILNVIKSGKTNLPSQTVFDGASDNKEAVDINLTITEVKLGIIVNKPGVINVNKAWLLQMGVYHSDNQDPDPNYETYETILSSGISLSMILSIAYGDGTFKAKATLTDVQVYS